MMKKNNTKMLALCAFLCALSACRNQTVEVLTEDEPIPVAIAPLSHIQSRVADGAFEADDAIGLYLLVQPGQLTDARHVDNMRFRYDGSSWMPDRTVYYPSAEDACDFLAYYPYREEAFAEGTSRMVCEVAADQSDAQAYSRSDFLVAEKTSVVPSADAVPLVFKHKLAEIHIEIKPGTAFASVEELLAASPQVTVKGVCLQGTFDFATKDFTDCTNPSDVLPAGQLTVEDDRLSGKRAIVIPQEVAGDHPLVEVKAGGKSYRFTFGEKHTIAPSGKEIYTLTLKRSAPEGIIQTEIADWEGSSSFEGDLNEDATTGPGASYAYSLPLPDFSASSVYRAMDGDRPVAEVCKEYLSSTDVACQAIVVYPVADGKADLAKGYVARLLDEAGREQDGNLHGGSATWDMAANALTYRAGTEAAAGIFVKEDGTFVSASVAESMPLTLEPVVVADGREDGTIYPVVKVATQYWLGKNLAARSFNDGTALPSSDAASDWAACITGSEAAYSVHASNHYYTFAAASGDIAPQGWKVPELDDWTMLRDYVGNDAALIAAWDGGSNLTGLSITTSGYRDKSGTYSTSANTAYFWHTQGGVAIYAGGIIEDRFVNQGDCIRCIRE